MAGKNKRANKRSGGKGRSRRQNKGRSQPFTVNGGISYGGFNSTGAAGLTQSRVNAGALHDFCASMCNPWDEKCLGMKYPDGLNSRSLTVQVRYAFAVSVDGAGALCHAIVPTFPYGRLTSSVTGVAATWSSAWSTHICPSLFTSNAFSYRTVCAGVRIAFASSVANTAGQLFLSTMSEAPLLNGGFTVGSYDGIENTTAAAAVGKEWTWVARPQGPRNFVSQTSSGAAIDTPMTCLVIHVLNGIPSATTLTIEVIANLEFTLNANSASQGFGHLARPDPFPVPNQIAVAQAVQNRLPSTHEGSPSGLRSQLMSEIRAALGSVAGAAVRKGERMAVAAIAGGGM